MKADLHVHSKFSKRPSEWILKKLDCPESFTEPTVLYNICKQKGMTHVTITDHNVINGCLEIAHNPDVFISEEVTTYFPDDGCKLHVLAYNIDEKKHVDIQKLRENVFELVAYLGDNGITHALAHPLYSVNRKLNGDHFEKCLLLFRNFELNGARSEEQNRCLQHMLSMLTEETMEGLVEKHGIIPRFSLPWRKNLIAGSDDHSALTIAISYTEVGNDGKVEDLLRAIEENQATVRGCGSMPKTLARNLYSVAYQFYDHKFDLREYVANQPVMTFLDSFLRVNEATPRGSAGPDLHGFLGTRKAGQPDFGVSSAVLTMLQDHIRRSVLDDRELIEILISGNGKGGQLDDKWFHVVNRVSGQVLSHIAEQLKDSFFGANFFTMFQSLGSVGALYCMLAPYFISYSIYAEDRDFSGKMTRRLRPRGSRDSIGGEGVKVAHFTDTFYEINGVAGTLRRQVDAARRMNKEYAVITCDAGANSAERGVRNFRPVGVYELSVYPEQKLFLPPFLDMLDYCYTERFTHIHAATPGPLGLAALAIARILRLPCVATYHTALPQYAQYLTDDPSMGEIMWRYLVWYYDQMEMVYVSSQATFSELTERGVSRRRIRMVPRGVDTARFNPSKRNGLLDEQCSDSGAVRLLYVGRVSKEKNLELLVNAFRSLIADGTQAYLVVVGDGPYREAMEKALEGTPSIFLGYREGEDLAAIYASCDAFVFPSVTDTFGNVVLEAQASGLPVVVTDQGGPRENMVHGRTGIMVEGNSIAGLRDGILRLIADPNMRRSMGSEARRHVVDRTFDKAFEEAWNLYEETYDRYPRSA
jgi:glycosyltransferase involved in cell wall biosynthesis